eukprot:5696784-Amphidinium_carterae.1
MHAQTRTDTHRHAQTRTDARADTLISYLCLLGKAHDDSRDHLQSWNSACPFVFDFDPLALHFGFPRESEAA